MPAGANLFLVGAMKAGTTSIHRVLSLHPEIFMSRVKEPRYFALRSEPRTFRGPADPDNQRHWAHDGRYASLFAPGLGSTYRGESSTLYLYHPKASGELARAVPEARILVVLRHPVERAYSQFNFIAQRGLEPERSFGAALALEDERVAAGWGSSWHYRRMSLYAPQVERYLERFPRSQLHFTVFDDLGADPAAFYAELLGFLGLRPCAAVEEAARDVALNRSHTVRSRALAHAVTRLRRGVPSAVRATVWRSRLWRGLVACLRPLYRLNQAPLAPLSAEAREDLLRGYREDLDRLDRLVGAPLSERWVASSPCT